MGLRASSWKWSGRLITANAQEHSSTFSGCLSSRGFKSLGDPGKGTLPLWSSNCSFVSKEVGSDFSQAWAAQMLALTFTWSVSPSALSPPLHSLVLDTLIHRGPKTGYFPCVPCTMFLKFTAPHLTGKNPLYRIFSINCMFLPYFPDPKTWYFWWRGCSLLDWKWGQCVGDFSGFFREGFFFRCKLLAIAYFEQQGALLDS